jgi:chorismate mutase
LTAAAAKQEAFEESTKLTNQFRSLDEDEIEFLDSVQERARAKELAEKKHTKEHLEVFRKQQEEAERVAKELEAATAAPPTVSETWAVGPRKRKKGKEKDGIGGLKIRRTSTGDKAKEAVDAKTKDQAADSSRATPVIADKTTEKSAEKVPDKPAAPTSPPPPPVTAAGLGLGAYSSDEE